jgi:hypothetical protein
MQDLETALDVGRSRVDRPAEAPRAGGSVTAIIIAWPTGQAWRHQEGHEEGSREEAGERAASGTV